MNCKSTQRRMPLAVGDDLSPVESVGFHEHLCGCTRCQTLWRQHQQGFAALVQSRVEEPFLNRDSVWPSVSLRIERQRLSPPRRQESNNWVATLFLTVACVLACVSLLEDYTFENIGDAGERRSFYGALISVSYSPPEPEPWISQPLTEPLRSDWAYRQTVEADDSPSPKAVQ